jgi:hypothetical protein
MSHYRLSSVACGKSGLLCTRESKIPPAASDSFQKASTDSTDSRSEPLDLAPTFRRFENLVVLERAKGVC